MSLESEHADMAARLRAIAQIVMGGSVPDMPGVEKPQTPGCNCNADGNPNPEAHAFGCPFSPVMREPKVMQL